MQKEFTTEPGGKTAQPGSLMVFSLMHGAIVRLTDSACKDNRMCPGHLEPNREAQSASPLYLHQSETECLQKTVKKTGS